ncbi:hypothetical protein HHI36_000436 [Cryptolaemus montrouzieri]|uniref:Uncharacterized protein n=1 Tax=Cryptolaemus montrouzieri TaxID=559131 RepID=A0ABD2P4X3_9CUCU
MQRIHWIPLRKVEVGPYYRKTSAVYVFLTTASLKNVNKQSSAVFVVTSSEKNVNVLDELKVNVDPKQLHVQINSTGAFKNGAVINCYDQKLLGRPKSEVQNRLGVTYSVFETKKLNPRPIIKGVDENLKNNEDTVAFILSNEHLQKMEDLDIKVITRLIRKYSQDVVMQVNLSTRNALLSKKFVFIDWNKYYIEDYH